MLRAAADVDAAWARARRRAADPRRRSCRSTASCRSSRCAAATATIACWPVVENAHRDGILRAHARARARARRRAPGARRSVHPAAARRRSTTSACAASSCSTSTASCSPTRSRRACTTAGTGRSKARRRASSRTTCARSLGWPLGSTAARGASAMVNCIGTMPDRDAVLARPGRAPARLRQGAAPRPQARPRHGHCAPTPAALEPRLARVVALVRRRLTASDGSGDRAGLAQLGDLVGGEAPVGERLVGVLAGPRRGALHLGRRCARSAAPAPAAARRRAR